MLSDEQKENRRLIMQGRSRDSKGRLLPATTAQEARIAELEAQVSQLQTSSDWNAAEVVRLAESLRLAKQGRDKAIAEKNGALGQYEAEFTRATTHMQARAKAEQELDSVKNLLSSLTKEVEAQKAAKQLAEGRYVALQRQRAGEWLIVMAFMALAVMPAVFIAGRCFGGLK